MNVEIKAFPTTIENTSTYGDKGMDLRDYFAAKAMQALLNSSYYQSADDDKIAKYAYEAADAMMEARSK
jgi:hypothetical protein